MIDHGPQKGLFLIYLRMINQHYSIAETGTVILMVI